MLILRKITLCRWFKYSVQGGCCFYAKAKYILSQASFSSHKFLSNLTDLETLVNGYENDIAQENVKVLGISWNKKPDEIIFNYEKPLNKQSTFRQKEIYLVFLASIYKPLGLLNLFVFRLKILFQEVCVQKLLWEESLFDS